MAQKKKTEKPPVMSPTMKSVEASPIERAFAAGNYADVRRLAAQEPGARAQQLLALTRIDKAQLIIGLIAILVTVTIALLTLR